MATLLSGWKIHLTDEAGFPLFPGRVQFFDALTSLPKAVYTTKELITQLGVVVDTDVEGNLPAIWLAEGRYKAIVQKQVSEDPLEYKVLWTINDLGEGAGASPAGSGTLAYCRNIPEMRAITAGTVDACIVAGYYNPGDCGDPMFFTFEQASTRTDDSGAFIRSNDTGAGTPGRYHQVFGNILDIRKWGGIPNDVDVDCVGALANMSNYAISATNFPDGAPRIGFPGTGKYYFSGPITLDALWQNISHTASAPVEYFVGNDVQFGTTDYLTPHLTTFTNACIIESESQLSPQNQIHFDAGSVPYIRPQWYSGYTIVDKIQTALSNGAGIPVKAYGTGCVGNSAVSAVDPIVWEGAPLSLDMVGWYMTLATGASISITCPLTVVSNDYIFRGSGSVSIGGDNQINARWFGWGILSGNQGVPLQNAINSMGNKIPVLVSYSSGSVTSTVTNTTVDIPFIQPTAIINFTGTGRLLRIGIIAEYSKQIFNNTGTGLLSIIAESISPMWYGAEIGITAGIRNYAALSQSMASAISMNIPLDGGGRTLNISQTLTPVVYNGSVFNISNITLKPSVLWNTATHGWMMTLSTQDGGGDFLMDKVVFNPDVLPGLRAMSAITYYQRVTNCFFGNDVQVLGSDYSYTGNQHYGAVENTSFYSASVAGIITGNTFTGTSVYLMGEDVVTGGRTIRYLENINFSNNNVVNNNSAGTSGRVVFYPRGVMTVVAGVVICNNIFKGHVNFSAVTGDPLRLRILCEGWVVSTATWGDYTELSLRHQMVIKDNVLNGGSHTGYQNLIPSTSGQVLKTININTPEIISNHFAYQTPNTYQLCTPGDICRKTFETSLTIYDGVFSLEDNTQTYNCYVMVPKHSVMHIVATPPSGSGEPDIDRYDRQSYVGSIASTESTNRCNTSITCESIRSNACNVPYHGIYKRSKHVYLPVDEWFYWDETASWFQLLFTIDYNIYEAV